MSSFGLNICTGFDFSFPECKTNLALYVQSSVIMIRNRTVHQYIKNFNSIQTIDKIKISAINFFGRTWEVLVRE